MEFIIQGRMKLFLWMFFYLVFLMTIAASDKVSWYLCWLPLCEYQPSRRQAWAQDFTLVLTADMWHHTTHSIWESEFKTQYMRYNDCSDLFWTNERPHKPRVNGGASGGLWHHSWIHNHLVNLSRNMNRYPFITFNQLILRIVFSQIPQSSIAH